MDIEKSIGIFGRPSFDASKEIHQILLKLGFPKTVKVDGDSFHTVTHQRAEHLRNLIELGNALRPLVNEAEWAIINRNYQKDA